MWWLRNRVEHGGLAKPQKVGSERHTSRLASIISGGDLLLSTTSSLLRRRLDFFVGIGSYLFLLASRLLRLRDLSGVGNLVVVLLRLASSACGCRCCCCGIVIVFLDLLRSAALLLSWCWFLSGWLVVLDFLCAAFCSFLRWWCLVVSSIVVLFGCLALFGDGFAWACVAILASVGSSSGLEFISSWMTVD